MPTEKELAAIRDALENRGISSEQAGATSESLGRIFGEKFEDSNPLLAILDVLSAGQQAAVGVYKEHKRRSEGFSPIDYRTQMKRAISESASFSQVTGNPVTGFLLDVVADPSNILAFGAGGLVVKGVKQSAVGIAAGRKIAGAVSKIDNAADSVKWIRSTRNALGTAFKKDFMLKRVGAGDLLERRAIYEQNLREANYFAGQGIKDIIEKLVPDIKRREELFDLLEHRPTFVKKGEVPAELTAFRKRFALLEHNERVAYRRAAHTLDELEKLKIGAGLLPAEQAAGFIAKMQGLNYVPHYMSTRDTALGYLRRLADSWDELPKGADGSELVSGMKLDEVKQWAKTLEDMPESFNTPIRDGLRRYSLEHKPAFTKTREIPGSGKEARAAGLESIDLDIANVLQVESAQVARAIITQNYMKDIANYITKKGMAFTEAELRDSPAMVKAALAKQFGEETANRIGRDQFRKLTGKQIPGLEGMHLPKAIAAEVETVAAAYRNTGKIEEIFNAYRKMTGFWKAWTLAPIPAYHFRNFVSNLWNQSLAGMGLKPMIEHNIHASILNAQWKKGIFLDDKIIANLSSRELHKEAVRRGILNTGHLVGELNKTVAENGRVRGFLLRELDPKTSKIINTGFQIGTHIEDSNRLGLFMWRLSKGDSLDDAAKAVNKYLFDYKSGLTQFEERVFRDGLVPFYAWCVPDDSECLTNEGWKLHHQLTGDEMVLGYDDGRLVWTELKEWQTFPYDGMLLSQQGKTSDILCTPNHRWYVYDQQGRFQVREAVHLRSHFKFPISGEYEAQETVSAEDAAKIGWIYTDGYVRKRGNHREAMIYQSPKKHLKKVVGMFTEDQYSMSFHPDSGVACVRLHGPERKRLMALCGSKEELPRFVSRLGPKAAESMYQSMMDAEGSRQETFDHFAQVPGPVLDAFQMLCLLTGRAANVSARGCYVRKAKFLKHTKWKTVWYKGKVWCPVTGTGNWFMRRNGKVVLTGNTRFNMPLQLERIAATPYKYTQVYKGKRSIEQSIGGPDPDQVVLADWIKKSANIRFGWNPKTETYNYFLLDSWWPAADIGRFFSSRVGDEIINMITPFGKVPYELLKNYNIFQDRKIVDFPGEKHKILGVEMHPYAEHLLRTVRVLNDIDRTATFAMQGENFSDMFFRGLGRTVFGRFYPVDYNAQRRWWESNMRRDVIALKGKRKSYERKGDVTNVRVLDDLIEKYEKLIEEHGKTKERKPGSRKRTRKRTRKKTS